MNKNLYLYTVLKCFVIIFLLAGVSNAQSVDTIKSDTILLKADHEVAPLYQYIDRSAKKYQINGRRLLTTEILNRLSVADSSAFFKYNKGRNGQKIGIALISGGAAFVSLGNIILIDNAFKNGVGHTTTDPKNTSPTGAIFLATGSGLLLTGIVKCIIGSNEKRKAVEIYNHQMSLKRKSLGFYVNPGLTGLSVGLRF